MRLINTETFELQEFFDSGIPAYAILSHRWEQDEVSYEDMLEGKKSRGVGYAKIRKFCALALRDHFQWAWVYSCCVDEKSSADLTEAINAMFSWYKRAKRCYVYLSDVKKVEDQTARACWPSFLRSEWFTRGWTLQELIAPGHLLFYDRDWHLIGSRKDMENDITAATGIPSHAFENPWNYSIAQRMSWASQRKTSRAEDIAYCLLGLFNVRMPIVYGEGAFAFQRLQEEIIKVSGDETIFVWSRRQTSFDHGPLMADSPACFAACGEVISTDKFWRKPYSMTNRGLKISTSLYDDPQNPKAAESKYNDFLMPLNCQSEIWHTVTSREDQNMEIPQLALRVRSYESLSDAIVSYDITGWCKMPAEAKQVESTKTIYITQNSMWGSLPDVNVSPNVQLDFSQRLPRIISMIPIDMRNKQIATTSSSCPTAPTSASSAKLHGRIRWSTSLSSWAVTALLVLGMFGLKIYKP